MSKLPAASVCAVASSFAIRMPSFFSVAAAFANSGLRTQLVRMSPSQNRATKRTRGKLNSRELLAVATPRSIELDKQRVVLFKRTREVLVSQYEYIVLLFYFHLQGAYDRPGRISNGYCINSCNQGASYTNAAPKRMTD